MKKAMSLLVVVMILLSLVACGNDNSVTTVDTGSSITQNQYMSTESSKTASSVHTHSYSDATCTEPAKCSCGVTDGTALGHSYINATCTDAKKCSRCGATDGSALGHNYNNATCTEPAKCSCGATDGAALGHSYSKATCTAPKKCSRCGVNNGSALGHNYSNADCVNPKKCTRCGVTDGEALGHSKIEATCTAPERCARCGEITGDLLKHNYSNRECVHCGKILVAESHGYSVGDVVTGTNDEGESYTMKYLGEDRWEDQNGRIWTSVERQDGMHWWSFD